jgi:uncharacterized lipoprotein YmbA
MPAQTPSPSATNGRSNLSIGVQPARMPDYLDRAEIVTYASPHELIASPDDRWAEPLPANVTRVLAENLSVLLGTDEVQVMPMRRDEPPDYEVAVEIDRFERTAEKDSVLDARWTVVGGTTGKTLVNRRTRLSARASEDGYAAVVAAMNENLTRLSQDIAMAIAGLRSRRRNT